MTDTDLLHTLAVRLMDDRAGHGALHRVLLALEASSDLNYLTAYDRWTQAFEDAGQGATVEGVLRQMPNVSVAAVREDVQTLERADDAKMQLGQRVAKLYTLGTPGVLGTHPAPGADAPSRIDSSTYARIMEKAPSPDHERYFQAKALSPHYFDGRDGEQQFARADVDHARAGLDLVGTLTQQSRAKAAQQQAASTMQNLDQALRQGKSPAERRKLLESAISAESGRLRQLEQAAGGSEILTTGSLPRHAPLMSVGLKRLEQQPGESKQEHARRVQEAINRGEI